MSATPKKSEQVAEFIFDRLKAGPVPSTQLHDEVYEEFGLRALYSAKKKDAEKIVTRVRIDNHLCWAIAKKARVRKAA